MFSTSPPPEAQRFGRSQTPESPRPLHVPEPSNIPVLRNQMDPVLNETTFYNIPSDLPASAHPKLEQDHPAQGTSHDAVQDFFRGAEAESSQTNNRAVEQTTHDEAQTESADPSDALSQAPISNLTAKPDTDTDITNLMNGTIAKSSEQETSMNDQEMTGQQQKDSESGGVDYQSLLDTISQSASTAPTADAITAPTTAAASDQDPNPSSLPSAHGLPPKPPALEHPAEFASYQLSDSAHAQISLSTAESQQQEASSAQNSTAAASHEHAYQAVPNAAAMYPAQGYEPATGVRPWSPRTQNIYDQFLEDERGYVTEGIWDKFPLGSRLFVGNLPSEKVTKRDLFHIFHRHGKLAQISIKQAYGFVQFLQAADCQRALDAEQGVEIRGRKIHLEISKPQKNTRTASGTKNERTNNNRRRSRSPARRGSNDRHSGRASFGDYRDRRDDFRRPRSPSPPRNYRPRDDPRVQISTRTPPRSYNSPQSPSYGPGYPPYQQQQQPYDEDAALSLPRRNPRDVPDVQVLILDQSVPQAFINWVEDGFRAKGLRASTIWLSPRLPLQAVIKRQILEGVHGIVKLLQMNSMTYKIPLQVFDRSSGASNVKFNEYVDLDLNVASDIILHTKRTQPSPTAAYPPAQAFNGVPQYAHQAGPAAQQYPQQGQPQYQQRPPQQQYQYPQQSYAQPQPHPPTPSSANSNAPNLQQLLANLRQPNDTAQTGQNAAQARPDLGGLLSNLAARQQNQQQAYPQASPQGYGNTPASAQSYGPPQPQNNVQNIMDQLARYQR